MKSVLLYPGAKNKISGWICSLMPEHNVYLEPYGGSLSILFNKKRSHIETVNDLDSELVNYFRVLRENPEALMDAVRKTPYAREEYENAFLCDNITNPVEKARRLLIRSYMGFGSSIRYKNGFRSGQRSNSPNPARGWAYLPDIMEAAAERLQGVQIECLPALELIKRYDTPDVFLYVDPPYLPSTRKPCLYKHEMTEKDHVELLELLTDHPGKIMISGYESALYENYLKNWRKTEKTTVTQKGNQKKEILWMNYPGDEQISFFDSGFFEN